MKTIMLFILLSVGFISNAQTQQKPIDLRLAGSTLEKSSDHLLSGFILTGVGCGLMVIGANNHEPLLYMGAGFTTLGVGFTISGIKKIGLAGRQLK